MTTQFPSRVNLSDEAKTKLIASLNTALATTLDLELQVKQAHWNVKGPQFFARHQLFDQLAMRRSESSDKLAERAATLGGYARGTVRQCAELSILPEYDLKASDGRAHIKTLAERFAKYNEMLRDGIAEAESKRDPATSDLYVEILRRSELDMWFLESHLLS